MQYLLDRPQYAYTPRKAIDEAIARVIRNCKRVRERLRCTERIVHDRRTKRAALPCVGGIMLGIDLSRAFDEIPRWALLLALQRSGAPEALQQAVMKLHASCKYTVTHKGSTKDFPMQRYCFATFELQNRSLQLSCTVGNWITCQDWHVRTLQTERSTEVLVDLDEFCCR